uniref:Large ribosomal subunit protein bL12 n=1 Tax=Candidatus Liberibacter americanus TaxID=309868 RepID=B3EZF7_9HYPH|nr:50S ribosomal subunit protein L12 [Candidatus Liberibacter americanus]
MSNVNLDSIVDQLCSLTLMQSSELSKKLEEKLGISAASFLSAAPAAQSAPADDAVSKAAEQTDFNVVLSGFADNSKIAVIKEVRTITSLGLKEAKALVKSCPKTIKEAVSKAEAKKIKEKLVAVGAKIDLE